METPSRLCACRADRDADTWWPGRTRPKSGLSGCGSAGDSSDQAFPFQCAASAFPALFQPTAVQFPVAGQDTP